MVRGIRRGVREVVPFYGVKIDPLLLAFDMGLAQPHSRSIRLNGFATCLRLEEVYWGVLENIAAFNQCSVNALLSYVDREVHLRFGGVKNFSGLVRVICVMYLLKPKVGVLSLNGQVRVSG
jgi:predicted DNA-binding ribbon-helix-helix protein